MDSKKICVSSPRKFFSSNFCFWIDSPVSVVATTKCTPALTPNLRFFSEWIFYLVNKISVRWGQVRSGQVQPWCAQRGKIFCNAWLGRPFSLVSVTRSAKKKFDNARLGHSFSLVSGARKVENSFKFWNPGARSAEKNFATLGWVTRFLWYLPRATWRKCCFCNLGAYAKNMKVLKATDLFKMP